MQRSESLLARSLVDVVLVVVPSALCTTVVGVSTADRVILGSDSKMSRNGVSGVGQICKIIAVANSAAAIAGHLGDWATAFDASTLIRQALSNPGALSAKAHEFERSVRDPLQRSLDYGRQHSPDVFFSTYAGKKALQTIFGAVQNGKPTLIVSTFRVNQSGGLDLDEDKELGPGQVYVFGESAAIAKYQTANPNWNRAAPLTIVRKFLELESADEPDLVGPPLTILTITSGGVQWEEAGLCGIPAIR